MKKTKKNCSLSFTLFKKVLATCFLYGLSTFTCLGYASLWATTLKDSIDSKHVINTRTGQGNDYAYFKRFFLKKDSTLLYPLNRFDNFISQYQNQSIADGIIDANLSSGCLCAGEPLFLTAKFKVGPTDVSPESHEWYYMIPDQTKTDGYAKEPISSGSMTIPKALDPYVQAIIPDVEAVIPDVQSTRDMVLNLAAKHSGQFIVFPNGPLSRSIKEGMPPLMMESFLQSTLNLIRIGGYMTGQEFYINLAINAAENLLKFKSLLNKAGVEIPGEEELKKALENAINSQNDAPDAYSVPIGIRGLLAKSGGGAGTKVESTTPYSRPIYTRPKKPEFTHVICSGCFVGTKPGASAKRSIYAPSGSKFKLMVEDVPNEDPRIHYSWIGLPSLKAFGLGLAYDREGYRNVKDPEKILLNNSLEQSGLYALMKYRGPIPPIGCASVSDWIELFVGCDDSTFADREGLIKLDGDYDFAFYDGKQIGDEGYAKREGQAYEPVVCEGDDIKIVSGGHYSSQFCKYTYEWYGPGKVLKEGSTDQYVMDPNVLIGGLTEVVVEAKDRTGKIIKTEEGKSITSTTWVPIETGETITIKNMTPEKAGVYTRIAMRSGNSFTCKQCFIKAQLTIAVKSSSPPKLTASAPVCEGEDLVISISPTTNDPAEYRWAHENKPDKWSNWSPDTKIIQHNATPDMSGIYLVKAKNSITYLGKGRGTKNGKDKTSICESINPVTITVEVKPKVYVNLSLSKATVYAGRESILTASFSGTVTAPAGGITITLKELGGNAIKSTDYELLPPSMYIPANKNSVSTTIISKWTKSTTGDRAKTIVVTGIITNSSSPSEKTCYVISTPVTLTIKPLFKPELINDPISSICSGDVVHIELSSTLTGTTYEWTASSKTSNVSGFESRGSSSTIHETLVNDNHDALSGTVVYIITPRVEDPENPNLYVNGEPKSLTITVVPISKKMILDTHRTSIDALSFDWKPENILNDDVTYRWYLHANKTGNVVKEGKGVNGAYSIDTPKPGKYKYYITTQEDGYCENESTEIELMAKHHIQLTFDKSSVKQGEKAILTASLQGAVIAPDEGITITLNENGSSAETGTYYNGLLSSIYIPKGKNSVTTTITTEGSKAMDADKVLVVNGHANDYIIKESTALTITRNTDNNKITLAFNKPTVDGGHVAKLTASLPPTIHAGHDIIIHLQIDNESSALADKNYHHLKTSITIPKDQNSFPIDAFTAKNNCVIDGSTTLTLQGVEPIGYEIQKPNPTVTILDKTGDNPANRKIKLDFELKEVRGSETDLLNVCLPHCVVSVNPIHIRLHKQRTALPDQKAKKNINYKEFSWDITIPANTNCTSVLVHTLIDRGADTKTLFLTGRTTEGRYSIYSDKVKIITPRIMVPNTFTPNGDGRDDTWEIRDLDLYRSCTITVYNRWEQIVYRSTGYPEHGGWDGTYQGHPLPVGTYAYTIDLKDGSPVLHGYVAIIR